MPVYFVYRCHYGAPNEKHVRRFEYDTVLEWAQAAWRLHDTREEANRYGRELFAGLDTDAFHTLFCAYPEHPMPHRPRNMADVKRWFSAFYCEEEAHGPHHIQCLTEWGDNQRAVYVFDDHYRARQPGKADFLLLEGWELPSGEADAVPRLPKTGRVEPHGGVAGTLYFISTYVDCKYNLEDLCDASHVRGLRVPDLARYLLLHPDGAEVDNFALAKVRSGLIEALANPAGEDAGFLLAIRDEPHENTHWAAYSDWLHDRDRPAAGVHLLELALRAEACATGGENRRPALDRVRTATHLAQVCKHEGRYPNRPGDEVTEGDWFEQFIFFDDRWAAAHPTLAAGVLTFASRWDVLT